MSFDYECSADCWKRQCKVKERLISSIHSQISLIPSQGKPLRRENETLEGVTAHLAEDVREFNIEVDQLLSYFEQKTGKERLASRRDISPAELKKWLPDVCIFGLQYDTDLQLKDITIQLMGTSLASFYGEVTGQSVFSHPSPEVGIRIMAACKLCINDRVPIYVEAQSLSEDKAHLKIAALYIPLSKDNTDIDRIFAFVRVTRTPLAEPQE